MGNNLFKGEHDECTHLFHCHQRTLISESSEILENEVWASGEFGVKDTLLKLLN